VIIPPPPGDLWTAIALGLIVFWVWVILGIAHLILH
jgi:hypothetical protein